MVTIPEAIRRDLAARASRLNASIAPDPNTRAQVRLRRATTAIGACCLALAVLVVPFIVLRVNGNESSHDRSSVLPATGGAGVWTPIPAAPLDAFNHLTEDAFWTGQELLVVSGGHSSDSAEYMEIGLFDPAQERWMDVNQPPLEWRDGYSSVWMGDKLLVWGGASDEGALANGATYDPDADRWTTLPPSPLAPRTGQTAVWTGSVVLIHGGSSCCASSGAEIFADAATYDPASAVWQLIPAAPGGGRTEAAAAWTGSHVLIWGGVEATGLRSDGVSYSPSSNSWSRLPSAPLKGRVNMGAIWTGKELLIWGGSSLTDGHEPTFADGAAYNPSTDDWRMLSPAPLSARQSMTAVWAGDRAVFWGGAIGSIFETGGEGAGDGATYSPAEDSWSLLSEEGLGRRIGAAGAWTGTQVMIWGGCCEDPFARTGFNNGGAVSFGDP